MINRNIVQILNNAMFLFIVMDGLINDSCYKKTLLHILQKNYRNMSMIIFIVGNPDLTHSVTLHLSLNDEKLNAYHLG